MLRSKDVQETIRILAAWTGVLARAGPQAQPPTLQELGDRHTSDCSKKEAAFYHLLDDAGVSEYAVKVTQRRFLGFSDLQKEFDECSDDEHRRYILAPLLASAFASGCGRADFGPLEESEVVWRAMAHPKARP